MDKNLSIVLVDKRPYRKIAQENWGLTNDQMRGKHVHHRIKRCGGGTNDPSNLYVCSPSMHRWGWHNGEEWIEWANEGSEAAQKSLRIKRETDPDWAEAERDRARKAAKLSHELHKGTEEYSERQRVKSIRSHVSKRKNWTPEDYDLVWGLYLEGVESGYLISKRLGDRKWKKYANMLKYAFLGFSFSQLTNTEEYLEEIERLEESPILHLIKAYND